jgi:hypothetical protein
VRCANETYISASTSYEGEVNFTAECNAGALGDCGWFVDLTQEPWSGGVTQEDVDVLHMQHVDFSLETRATVTEEHPMADMELFEQTGKFPRG